MIGLGLQISKTRPMGGFSNVFSLLFDRADELLQNIGTVSDFSFIQNTGIFSIHFFMKFTDFTADTSQSFMGNNSGTSGEKGFFILYDNRSSMGSPKRLNCTLTMGGGNVISSLSANDIITDNNWHSIGISGDGTNIFFYVDDVKTTGSNTMGTLSTGDSTNILQLGKINNLGSLLFGGNLDNVAVWNSLLTDADYTALHGGGTPIDAKTIEPANLKLYLPFDDPRDNFNDDVANEWVFFDQSDSALTATSLNMEFADRVEDIATI